MNERDLFDAMELADAKQIAAALGEISEPLPETAPAEKPVKAKPEHTMNPVWRWILTAGCAAACIGSAVMLIHLIPKNDYTYMQQSADNIEVTRDSLHTETTAAVCSAGTDAQPEQTETEPPKKSAETVTEPAAEQTAVTTFAEEKQQTEPAKTTAPKQQAAEVPAFRTEPAKTEPVTQQTNESPEKLPETTSHPETESSAQARHLTPKELIEKYADYAASEVSAHYAVARAPVALYEDEAGMEKCRQIEILIPREVGSNELITTTLGAYMQDLEEKYATYQESAYRGYAYTARKSYQFYRNCCYENGFYYILMEDGNASIVGVDTGWYNAKGGGDIDIPAQIGGTVVTRIEDYAFSELGACLAGVKDINMPDTVETIGIGAFLGVGGQQTKIHLSQNLKAIQTLAFWDAEDELGDEFGVITLPDSLEFLGYRVFSGSYLAPIRTTKWSYLIQMPESPVYMDSNAFFGRPHSEEKTETYEESVNDAKRFFEDPIEFYTPYQWELLQRPDNAGKYERDREHLQLVLDWAEKYDAKKQPRSTDFNYNTSGYQGGGMLYDRYNIVSVYDSINYKSRLGIESDTDYHPVHFSCDGEIAVAKYDDEVLAE